VTVKQTDIGFDGRVFLEEEEWKTYLRRKPVRYVRKKLLKIDKRCEICGRVDSNENPIQAAHRVPFSKGIKRFAFTPDWLDRTENLGWACRKTCNSQMEWNDDTILTFLERNGYELPGFIVEKY